MAASAKRGVLETPELLEMILLRLSRPDWPGIILTKAQRVSRLWRDTIVQSPSIQHNLGLRPRADWTIRPLGFLSAHLWPLLPTALFIRGQDLPVYPHYINENRRTRRRGLGHVWLLEGSVRGHANHVLRLSGPNFTRASSADFRPTWLGLFLTNPRITVACLELELGHRGWSVAAVHDPEGLTFETVLKAAEKMPQSAPEDTEGREDPRLLVRFVSKNPVIRGDCFIALRMSTGLSCEDAVESLGPPLYPTA